MLLPGDSSESGPNRMPGGGVTLSSGAALNLHMLHVLMGPALVCDTFHTLL